MYSLYHGLLQLDDVKQHLIDNAKEMKNTDYRRILCLYDMKKYSN